ncbi:MAG: hypothetical protein ABIZ56_00440 [Chthoniobacteraceae bacterium]
MVRDYVMRLVEQVAKMLASVFAKRAAGQHDEARQELNAICQQHVGLTLDFVKRTSPEAVTEALAAAGALRHARAVLLSDLLTHDADLSDDTGRASEATVARLHAFCLLADSMQTLSQDEQATYRPKLDRLAESLSALSGNPYVQSKLQRYRGV